MCNSSELDKIHSDMVEKEIIDNGKLELIDTVTILKHLINRCGSIDDNEYLLLLDKHNSFYNEQGKHCRVKFMVEE